MCGEASLKRACLEAAQGLSPRVRGSRLPHTPATRRPRIIPACAGKPKMYLLMLFPHWDYPRVCGEAAIGIISLLFVSGLSPRVRGSHARRSFSLTGPRIIPACAGKPRQSSSFLSSNQDYPRVCGEACFGRGVRRGTGGLSPRVRGSPLCPPPPFLSSGIIPACAGKPRRWPLLLFGNKDYPRVCGEAPRHQVLDLYQSETEDAL